MSDVEIAQTVGAIENETEHIAEQLDETEQTVEQVEQRTEGNTQWLTHLTEQMSQMRNEILMEVENRLSQIQAPAETETEAPAETESAPTSSELVIEEAPPAPAARAKKGRRRKLTMKARKKQS